MSKVTDYVQGVGATISLWMRRAPATNDDVQGVLVVDMDGSDTVTYSPLAKDASLRPRNAATATAISVAASATSGQLLPANTARKGLTLVNDSTAILYLLYGTGTASATNYTYLLPGSSSGLPYYFEMPEPVYTGVITGVWASATGTARGAELT